MNGHALPAGTPAHPRGWHEFCELHAISTAKELARHYLRFATEHPHHDLLAAENFSVHFTDLFQQYFCNEVKEGFAMSQLRILPAGPARDYRETQRRHTDASLGTVATKTEAELAARPEQPVRAPEAAPTGLRKSWSSEELAGPARRPFSLSQLRRSWRSLFRRRSSDALPAEADGDAAEAALKPGLSKRILPWGLSREQPPEVRKEGLLKYGLLDESSLDSGTRWQRCRLVLRRAGTPDSEEYVLELFDPPKVRLPRLVPAQVLAASSCLGLPSGCSEGRRSPRPHGKGNASTNYHQWSQNLLGFSPPGPQTSFFQLEAELEKGAGVLACQHHLSPSSWTRSHKVDVTRAGTGSHEPQIHAVPVPAVLWLQHLEPLGKTGKGKEREHKMGSEPSSVPVGSVGSSVLFLSAFPQPEPGILGELRGAERSGSAGGAGSA